MAVLLTHFESLICFTLSFVSCLLSVLLFLLFHVSFTHYIRVLFPVCPLIDYFCSLDGLNSLLIFIVGFRKAFRLFSSLDLGNWNHLPFASTYKVIALASCVLLLSLLSFCFLCPLLYVSLDILFVVVGVVFSKVYCVTH